MCKIKKTVAVIGGGIGMQSDDGIYLRRYYGIVVDEMASRFDRVILGLSQAKAHENLGWKVASNVSLILQPNSETAVQGLIQRREAIKLYNDAVSMSDIIFVRGNLIPAINSLYKLCHQYNKPVCHWLVGNPMALLQSHKRYGLVKDTMGKCFTAWWDYQLMRGRSRARGALLCNGQEIADRFASPNTHVTVSSTVRETDFYMREDTCQSDRVRLTCVGFIRPEKGVEYLLEALGQLKTQRPVELVMVGSRDRYPAYQSKLDSILVKYGIADRVTWAGHAGPDSLKEHLRASDIFVLPTLSEGTPRVLVEARAYGVPVISTNVGGIPTSVTDGYDGLLVEPKDSKALAAAIDRIIDNDDLRRRLIKNGYERAGELTVEKFVDQIVEIYRSMGAI